MTALPSPLTPALTELAHAYGVATDFWDWQGQPRHGRPRNGHRRAHGARRRRTHAGVGRAVARRPARARRGGARCRRARCVREGEPREIPGARAARRARRGARAASRTAGRAAIWRTWTAMSSRARSTVGWSARRRSCCRPTCRWAGTRSRPSSATADATVTDRVARRDPGLPRAAAVDGAATTGPGAS